MGGGCASQRTCRVLNPKPKPTLRVRFIGTDEGTRDAVQVLPEGTAKRDVEKPGRVGGPSSPDLIAESEAHKELKR